MQSARQAAKENSDDEALLDYIDSDEELSADEEDPWSPDAAVPDMFDGADAEENPDLLAWTFSLQNQRSPCAYMISPPRRSLTRVSR